MSLLLSGDTFVAPGPGEFWQPLIGGDTALAFTRPALLLIISVVFLTVLLARTTRKLAVVPSRTQFLVEGCYNLVRNSIARDVIGSREFLKFVPLLFTMFMLILTNNFFGNVVFLQFPTMSRLAFPLLLTVIVYLTYHIVGLRRKGFIGYFKSFVPSGLPIWLVPVMFLIEFMTYMITRPLTLALRLFGNMFAGHLLILVFVTAGDYLLLNTHNVGLQFSGVLSFAFSILMSFFEILIQFLQAYIFTMLTALYLAGAVADEH